MDIRLPTISAGLTISSEYRSPRASRQALIRRKESSLSSDNGNGLFVLKKEFLIEERRNNNL